MPENPSKSARPIAAQPKSVPTPPPSVAAPSARVLSLDALRGFDMFWIVGGEKLALATLALFPESSAPWVEKARLQFTHVRWEGFRAWDLIMPLFLFVVGAAMPFSFARRAELGHSNRSMVFKLLRRTLILFVLGMAVQGHLLDFHLATLHPFSNTLQAIAVGYLFAGICMLLLPVWAQVATAIFLMLAYWLLLRFVPVPGSGAGVFEEQANVAFTFGQWVMRGFIDGTNPPYTWVLSGLTFTATTLLGVFAGYLLRSSWGSMMKFVWLILLGVVCLAAGWAWAEYLHFPIIKHIWTSSMVLWAAGWSYLLLALFYLVFDVIGLRLLAFPFVVIGMNAITIYVAYHFVPFEKIAAGLVGGLGECIHRNFHESYPHFASTAGPFLIALTTVALVWLLLYHLYRHKIFLRI